jgi:hypothetical protein
MRLVGAIDNHDLLCRLIRMDFSRWDELPGPDRHGG